MADPRGATTPWGSETRTLTPEQAQAGGYVMGPAGYYLTPEGDLAPGQVTPGMRDNPGGQVLYDAEKDLNYLQVNGVKVYLSPVEFVDGKTVYRSSLGGPPISDTGGGLVHGQPQWNPQSGRWDVDLDWGKVMSWAIAGGLSAGVLSAAMAGGGAAGAAGAGAEAAGAAGASGAGSAVLPSTAIGTGMAGGIPGGAGLGAGAAGAGAAGVGGAGFAAIPETVLGTQTGLGSIGTGLAAPTGTSVGMLGSTQIGSGMAQPIAGSAGGSGLDAVRRAGTGLGNQSLLSRIGDLAGPLGEGLGQAGQASADRQFTQAELDLQASEANRRGRQSYIDQIAQLAELGLGANQQNISGRKAFDDALLGRGSQQLSANQQNITGNAAYEDQLLSRAQLEGAQRSSAYKDVARASLLRNMPQSQYNLGPQFQMSPELEATLTALERQGMTRLQQDPGYDTSRMKPLREYTPFVVDLPAPKPYEDYQVGSLPVPEPYTPVQPSLSPSALQQVGNWAAPTASALSLIADWYRRGR